MQSAIFEQQCRYLCSRLYRRSNRSILPRYGDFLISDEEISSRFGVKVVRTSAEELETLKSSVTDAEIQSEMAEDLADAIKLNQFSEDAHRLTVKNCLAVRRWLEKHQLDAFSVDFMDISSSMDWIVCPLWKLAKQWRGVLVMQVKETSLQPS